MDSSLQNRGTSVLEEHRAVRPQLDLVDSKILSLFQEREFHSIRTLAQELNVFLSTVYARLTDPLGFSLRHTQWVPHLLTDELKATTVATSMTMFKIPEQQELTHFAGIITRNESWFLLEYSRNQVRRLGNENAPERISQQIDTEKHRTGSLVDDWLSTNASLTSMCFSEVIGLPLASAAVSDQAGQRKRRVYLHIDIGCKKSPDPPGLFHWILNHFLK
jgi:hypothetical protein